MMNLILHRTDLRQDCTLGVLELIPHQDSQIPVFTCATLEPGTNGKGPIKKGRYLLSWRWSSHFGRLMPFLDNVPGFTGIMIHPGNTAKDTRGCILVGQQGVGMIVKSRQTFAELEVLLRSSTDPVWITIE